MTTSVVFGVIIVIWAVVLIPMWLRRHDETEETRSVDTFSKAMHTLSRRESAAAKRRKYAALIPTKTSNHEVHVSGASADGQRPRVQRRQPTVASAARAAERRRRTFTGLLSVAVLTVMLAVFMGGMIFWALQILVDIALISFVVHLRNRARHAALIRPRTVRAQAEHYDDVYDEQDEYDDFAPDDDRYYEDEHRYEPAPIRTARVGRPVYSDEFEAPEHYEPARRAAAGGAIFDQEFAYDEDRPSFSAHGLAAPRAQTEIVFDQAEDFEPVASRRRPRYDDEGRDVEIDIAFGGEPTRPQRPAASDIGARPWEPVPVPRPIYASKPAAPQRRTAAPTMEPLLPPVETADLPPEQLEEILDRRWAVND